MRDERHGRTQPGSQQRAGAPDATERADRPDNVPTPSLPKGGGAIRGIGERFSTNPATGTASVTVPIFFSEGRGKFCPQLALSYDSGAGNGVFGLGWSIGLPSISRRLDKRLPRYDDGDVFVLAGAEDLVPVGAAVRDGFEVTRYRPRVEDGFLRIERWRDRGSGEAHWRTIDRDNVTSWFGRTAGSRIADPERPDRVYRWLIDESADGLGNRIVYEYRAENRDGVDLHQPWEQGRAPANAHLLAIHYGNRTPGGDDWLFHAVFDYGQHDAARPSWTETGAWRTRPDPFSICKPGFEVRTYRLCRRVLMFHEFTGTPGLGAEPVLVRSTELDYVEDPVASFLRSVTQTGWSDDAPPLSYPPLALEYTAAALDPTVRVVDPVSAANLPAGVDGAGYRFVDLDGEGVPGVLAQAGAGWFYKRSLGGGRFAPIEALGELPAGARDTDRLVDLSGDGGKALVRLEPTSGFHRRGERGWEPFRAFADAPAVGLDDPAVRLIDLDGDGIPDLLLTEHEALRWYPSEGERGYGPSARVAKPADEADGPAVVFDDGSDAIYLADMTGDGLSDIVRIRSGEVCYWPNRGYGRFGRRIEMGGAPDLRLAEFDPKRVRLIDIDGSGTTDVLYLGERDIRFWINQAGNRFAAPQAITGLPVVDTQRSVEVTDLLGSGTACLVWSSPLPGDAAAPLRYIDLMGGTKPHLLARVRNGLGWSAEVHYAPSTKFYLADRAAGAPWVTRLPFPVQVVEQVETRDDYAGSRLTTIYRYHHGFWDAAEREFRGFGAVDQEDSQRFSDAALHVPPTLTRSWFHTGVYLGADRVSRQYAHEYWPAAPARLGDSEVDPAWTAAELREAARALRGKALRTEIYALDEPAIEATARPYYVEDSNYTLRRLAPPGASGHGVFYGHAREVLRVTVERQVDDWRVHHHLVLDFDEAGSTTEELEIGYPRAAGDAQQRRAYLKHDRKTFIHKTTEADWYRVRLPSSAMTHELTVPAPSARYSFRDAQALVAAAFAAPALGFGEVATFAAPQRRLARRSRTLYYTEDLTAALPFGDAASHGLVHQAHDFAFDDALIAALFGALAPPPASGGYVNDQSTASEWWIPAGRKRYDAAQFFLQIGFVDPFGNASAIAYDPYRLFPATVTDPALNVTSAEFDYRALQPSRIVDPNGNRAEARFDPLGRMVAMALAGSAARPTGDSLAGGQPTMTSRYAFAAGNQPSATYTRTREQHAGVDPAPRWQESYAYADGRGKEIAKKTRAPDGLAPPQDPLTGALVTDGMGAPLPPANGPRWVGTGRVVFDDKSQPVKQYEPYYASVAAFDADTALGTLGVTAVLHYDPLRRTVRTDQPDGTFTRNTFSAWQKRSHDENDNLSQSAWYTARKAIADLADPERRAADITEPHDATPTVTWLDPLERSYRVDEDCGADGVFTTFTVLDITGNAVASTDPLGHTVSYALDAMGRRLRTVHPDRGPVLTWLDALGKPMHAFDADGTHARSTYDVLRRPLETFATAPGGAERLVERVQWGEGVTGDAANNLRGREARHFDGAGLTTKLAYDVHGNCLHYTRELAAEVPTARWPGLAGQLSPAQVDTWLSAVALDRAATFTADAFDFVTEFDAISRPTRLGKPDGAELRYAYDDLGLLLSVTGGPPGEATDHVQRIEYNARRQRTSIRYGNGALTEYEYDPGNFFLVRQTTTPPAGPGPVQDLRYTYDPVGNPVEVSDLAREDIYFSNNVVRARSRYRYDPTYRLIYAEGREHLGQTQPPDDTDWPVPAGLPHPNDPQAMSTWDEQYRYDTGGNLRRIVHRVHADGTGYTRNYVYGGADDRLTATTDGGGATTFACSYDPRGNMTSATHLGTLAWDHASRLVGADRGGGARTVFSYDAAGVRARKIVYSGERAVEERLYFDGYEVYRRYNGATSEQRTLHVLDDKRRVALVDWQPGQPQATRYTLDDLTGSTTVELDEQGRPITFEEYHPFGTTSFRSARTGVSQKRYRFLARERDDNGLYYLGARYYLAWLGRWLSPDPEGTADGFNLYGYAHDNPIRYSDVRGSQSDDNASSNEPQANQPLGTILNGPFFGGNNPVGTLSTDIFLTPLNFSILPSDPSVGPAWTPTGLLQVRDRLSTNAELGVFGGFNATVPFGAPRTATGGGTLGTTLHLGPEQPTDASRYVFGQGLWLTLAQVWGVEPQIPGGLPPPPGWSFNPNFSVMYSLGWLRANRGEFDLVFGGGVGRWGQVNGVSVGAPVNAYAGVSYTHQFNDNHSIFFEATIGTNLGLAGRFDGGPAAFPASLTTSGGIGYIYAAGDYGIVLEPWVFAEPTSSVAVPASGGTPAGPFGNFGGGLRFNLTGINPRRRP